MLHIAAGVCDIQCRLNEDKNQSDDDTVEVEVCNEPEHATQECNGDPAEPTADEVINEKNESDPPKIDLEITDSHRDVEETVSAEGKTFSCEIDPSALPSTTNMASVPGMSEVSSSPQYERTLNLPLEKSCVEVKRETTSEMHSAKLSPILQACNKSNTDSIMTDSGISEQTSTESDYSDSLEQDDESAQMPDINQDREPNESDVGPDSEDPDTCGEFVPLSKPKNADLSWYDFQSNDFFIDFKLNNDDAPFVEFDPFNPACDIRTLGSQGSEENLPISTYDPSDHDFYEPCKAFKFSPRSSPERDRSISGQSRNSQVPRQTIKKLTYFSAPWLEEEEDEIQVTSDQGQESGARRCTKVIDYDFVMHDETWGYSSHEPFFDVITGQRILSTIYEFEVSEDEDTESVMTEPLTKPEELRTEHCTSEYSVQVKENVMEDGIPKKDYTADCGDNESVSGAPSGDRGDSFVSEFKPDTDSNSSSGTFDYASINCCDIIHTTADTAGSTTIMDSTVREDNVSNMNECMQSEASYPDMTMILSTGESDCRPRIPDTKHDQPKANNFDKDCDLGDENMELRHKNPTDLVVDNKVDPLNTTALESSPTSRYTCEGTNITPAGENDTDELDTNVHAKSTVDTLKFDPELSGPLYSEVHTLSEYLSTVVQGQNVISGNETAPPPPLSDIMQSKTVNRDTSNDISFDNRGRAKTVTEENVRGIPGIPIEDSGVEGSGENVRKIFDREDINGEDAVENVGKSPDVLVENPDVMSLRDGVRKVTELLTESPFVKDIEEDVRIMPELSAETPDVGNVSESLRMMPALPTDSHIEENLEHPELVTHRDHFAGDASGVGEKAVDCLFDFTLEEISRLDRPQPPNVDDDGVFALRCSGNKFDNSLEISASLGGKNSEESAQEFPCSVVKENKNVETGEYEEISQAFYTEITVDEGEKCFEGEVMPVRDAGSEADQLSNNPAIGFDKINEVAKINKNTDTVKEDCCESNMPTQMNNTKNFAKVDCDENKEGSITCITDTCCEPDEVAKSDIVNQTQNNNNKTSDPDKSVGTGSGSGCGGGVSQMPSPANKPTNLTPQNRSSPLVTKSGENEIYQPGFDSKLESEGIIVEEDMDAPQFSPPSLPAVGTVLGENEIYQPGFDSKLQSELALVEEELGVLDFSLSSKVNRGTCHNNDDNGMTEANLSEDCFDLSAKLYFQNPSIIPSNIIHPTKEQTKDETKLMNEVVEKGAPQKVASDKSFMTSTASCSHPSQLLQGATPDHPPSKPVRKRMWRHPSRPQRKSLPEDHSPEPSELRRTKTDDELITGRPTRPMRRKTVPGKRSKSKENMKDTVESVGRQVSEKDSGSERSYSMTSAYSEDEIDSKDRESVDLEIPSNLIAHDNIKESMTQKQSKYEKEGMNTEMNENDKDIKTSPKITTPYHLEESEVPKNDKKTDERLIEGSEDTKGSIDVKMNRNAINEDFSHEITPLDHLEKHPELNDESIIIGENLLTEGHEPKERSGGGGDVLEVRGSTGAPRTPEVDDALTFAEEGVLENTCNTEDTPLVIIDSRCLDVTSNKDRDVYPALGAGNENGKEDVISNKEPKAFLTLEAGYENGDEDMTNLEEVQRCIDRLESNLTQQIGAATDVISTNSSFITNSDAADVCGVTDHLDLNYEQPPQKEHIFTPHPHSDPQTEANTPCTNTVTNPLPPRRKKKTPPIKEAVSGDETVTSDEISDLRQDENQAPSFPVPPMRKKKQFYSLPRKPKQPTPTPPSRRPLRRTASARSSHPEKVKVVRQEEMSTETSSAPLDTSCVQKSPVQTCPAQVGVSRIEKVSPSPARLKGSHPEEISTPVTSQLTELKGPRPVQLFTSHFDDNLSHRDEGKKKRKSLNGRIAKEEDMRTIKSLTEGSAKDGVKEHMKSLSGDIAYEVPDDSEENANVLLVRHVRTHSDGGNEEQENKRPTLKRTGSLKARMYHTLQHNFARNPLHISDGGKLRLSKFFTLKHRSYDIQNSEMAFADKNDSRESYQTSQCRSPSLFRACLKGNEENDVIKTNTEEAEKTTNMTKADRPLAPVRQHKRSKHPEIDKGYTNSDKSDSRGDLSPQLNRTEVTAEPLDTDTRQPVTLTEATHDDDHCSELSDPTRRTNTTNESAENEYENDEDKRNEAEECETKERGDCERNDGSKLEKNEAKEYEENEGCENKESTLVLEEADIASASTRLEDEEPASPSDYLEDDEVFWDRPSVPLRTWAERQGISELQLPPLHLRYEDEEEVLADGPRRGCPAWLYERDTPSPGPPVDADKDRHPSKQQQQQQQQKREDDRTQKDRCVEVYPETVRQRQRNMMAAANKVDIKNWNSSGPNNNNHTATTNNNNDTLTSPSKVKKFLPSVKALRNQFETGKANGISNSSRPETNGTTATTNGNGTLSQSRKSSTSNSSLASSTVDNKSSSTNSLHSPSASVENLIGSPGDGVKVVVDRDEPVEPIFNQFKKVDEELRELMSKPPSTTGWNPRSLLKRLYYIPDAPRLQSQGTTYVNIEGYLEKLPSGRKKATFWNAWKRRYFVAKDGVLYYYQGNQTEKPSMKMSLMGGRVESMDPNMVGVDDGKGHYVVVRCTSRQEAERWRRALETHTVEDFASQYVQPWPMPTNPTLLRDTLVIDIGSASIRAGILASQATLPQLFMPSVVANSREGRRQVWGFDALAPEVRSGSSIAFPIRPSQKISKYSVDLSAVSSLLQKTFAELKVDPKNYHIQLSVPRVLNTNTQAELLRVLFDKHGVRSVNLTHQSILALYAYNATSGIVVDVGERMDIVPVIDGYIVDGGVSRVPYGGYRILDHLRQFLYMRNVSLINEVESYIIRHVLENVCYSAHHYNTEKARCTANPDSFEKTVSLKEYFSKDCPYESISLDFGRFQSTEGLFNPDAWGLDHPGLHKLVHKAIMECSMDIRKEMSRSIFLAGGVTQMPGLVDRLTTEIDNLTPPAIRPKVHASPYRYHAAYIGACVLAESPAFAQSRITKEDWTKYGNASLRKWSL